MEEKYQILIPTDYSETADHALAIGADLAKRSGAQVHVLHIADIPPDWVSMVEKSEGTMYAMVKDQLGITRKELADRTTLLHDKGVHAESFMVYNKGYRAILGHSENYESDLIIMGAHGRSGIKGLLIGSFTLRVLHHTNVPVFVTKKTDMPTDLNKAVFVSDFDSEHKGELAEAIKHIQKFNMRLRLFFVNTPATFRESHEIQNRMNEYVKSIPEGLVEQVDIVNAYKFETGLLRYCDDNAIDMVSMPIYGKRHSWEAIGSTIEDVIKFTEIPVLGIPEGK
ncbi:hypothetical protein BFP97_05565 [Roseivirga sp. 4D4]|uniref:universal stress protein n=1 Tax=Roseivirga sp. 4D4 TaxID=1889784 RepID=UPI000853D01D|nr:universal stress protein [Roseivirga sp. 4D4]OEK01010.1 hypothetical protein BFP97_05565 [Roseivirga sp. 4D4]